MYFYNDYSKPLLPKGFTATVSVLDKSDQEIASYELKPGRISNALEARLNAATLPLSLLARVKFTASTEKPNVFNFAFTEATIEPKAPPVTTRSMPTPMPTTPAAATAATTVPTPSGSSTSSPGAAAEQAATTPQIPSGDITQPLNALAAAALDEAALPKATPELLSELSKRSAEIEQLVQEGNLAQVWLPAMGTKTVALALEAHVSGLPERQRILAAVAIKRVVTAAWELDAYGDLGNKQKIADAYKRLASAVADLRSAYGAQ